MNDRILRLEEKIAHLERHVTEQDKAMLEFAADLARLQRELKSLRERDSSTGGTEGRAADAEAADERPPHY